MNESVEQYSNFYKKFLTRFFQVRAELEAVCMKKASVLYSIILGGSCFSAGGCTSLVSIPLNLLGMGAVEGAARKTHADECAQIEQEAEKKKMSHIERRRQLNIAGCPL